MGWGARLVGEEDELGEGDGFGKRDGLGKGDGFRKRGGVREGGREGIEVKGRKGKESDRQNLAIRICHSAHRHTDTRT